MPRSRSLTDRGDSPGRLRQLLLSQPGLGPQLPQQPREPSSRLPCHRPHAPQTPAVPTGPGQTQTHAPEPTQTRSPRHLPASASRGQQRIAGARHAGSARFADPPGLSQSAPGLATAAASGQASGFMWVFVWAVACGEPAGRW